MSTRTSTVSGGMLPASTSQEDLRREKTSKAQKILGATDAHLQDYQKGEEKKKGHRPSFMRNPETKSKKTNSFVAFPTPPPEASLPPPHLRVRASSPLLGQDYRSQDASPPPLPTGSKKIHQSGSSSALYSYFTSRDPSSNSTKGSSRKGSTQSQDKYHQPQQATESNMGIKQPSGKESKRKMRPPRIDLSMLFPKPSANAAPLLSPQRMVSSPSSLSVASEFPSTSAKKPDDHATAKKITKTPPPSRRSGRRPSGLESISDAGESSTSFDARSLDWTDPSLERAVPTSEMDMALDKYSDTQRAPRSAERVQSSRPHARSRDRPNKAKPTDESLWKVPSNSSVGGWSKETYLSPKTCSRPKPDRVTSSSNDRRLYPQEKAPVQKESMSKKSSKSTLKNSDLNNSSVLCLSSSEDESDEEEQQVKDLSDATKALRDSVTTYGEFEPEICTASAAQATRGRLRRVDRPISTSTRGSRPVQRQPSIRNPSMSSMGRSSMATRKSQSRRSSGIPTISEPEFFHGDPIFSQLRNNPAVSQKELNRRSRIMSVTRQEEDFLAAMRQRKGKITPSIFQESRYNKQEPDRNSMLSVAPSADSFYGSDTSFLRLSPGYAPSLAQLDQSVHHFNKDKYNVMFQNGASDAERKTLNSNASPRASLVYSESLPSPATSAASPMTPTLPIHRFSPLPSQKPVPRHPPPAAPPVSQRRHSRRRTDSSEAIVLGDAEEPKEQNEFPLWAMGWTHEGANLATVH